MPRWGRNRCGEGDDGRFDVDQMPVLDVAAAGQRDAFHRVGGVLIATGEEPESVFTGQRLASTARGPGDVVAPRLATEVGGLVDGDRETAFDQFVRRRQPGHAAAEDGDVASSPNRCRGYGAGARNTHMGQCHGGTGQDGRGRRTLQNRPPRHLVDDLIMCCTLI